MTEKSEDITTGESRAPNDTPVDANLPLAIEPAS